MAIIQSGSFTSTGERVNLSIRSDLDFMMVMNFTELTAANANRGVQYFWQRGLADENGIVVVRNAAATAVDFTTSDTLNVQGFSLFNDQDTVFQTGTAIAVTGITNANPPVVNTANTAPLSNGDTVRIINVVGAQQLGGFDFTIDTIIANTSFELANMTAIANANPGAGFYRKVLLPSSPFYPRWRYISTATSVAAGSIFVTCTTTVDHGYLAGQQVRLIVPAVYGYSDLNGTTGVITSVTNAATFVVRLDSIIPTGVVTFPLTADVPFSPALVVPMGEGHQVAGIGANTINDATDNIMELGISLFPGVTGPAGSNGDLIYWQAVKSDQVD